MSPFLNRSTTFIVYDVWGRLFHPALSESWDHAMPMSPFVLENQALCKDLTVSMQFLIVASLTYDDISFIVEPRPALAHAIDASL